MDRHNLWISVDNYKRSIFVKTELKRVVLKSIRRNRNTTYGRRYLAAYYLSTLPRFSASVISNTRCVYSGRSWGTSRKYQMSRFVQRSKIYNSVIPGCRRASW